MTSLELEGWLRDEGADGVAVQLDYVVVTDAGLALASNPDAPLRPTSLPRVVAPPAGAETREWKFDALSPPEEP